MEILFGTYKNMNFKFDLNEILTNHNNFKQSKEKENNPVFEGRHLKTGSYQVQLKLPPPHPPETKQRWLEHIIIIPQIKGDPKHLNTYPDKGRQREIDNCFHYCYTYFISFPVNNLRVGVTIEKP